MEKLNAFVEKLPDIMKPWGQEMLLRYVDFQGRTDRKTFWVTLLTSFVISCILGVLCVIPFIGVIFSILTWLYSMAMIVPGIAIWIRRLNDIGKSWPFIFLGFIPCVGGIILIVFACMDSAA